MNNLAIAVIAIAVAQALTILLTIGREREIRRLRELVTEQQVQIAEIKAWLAGRIRSAQSPRIKPEREPTREPVAGDMRVREPAITPKDSPDPIRPGTTKDELQRATKAFRWFREDADEPREIVAGLKRPAAPQPAITTVPEPAITSKDSHDTLRQSTTEDELERATKAINSLKDDVDKARAIVAAQQADRTGPVMPLERHIVDEVDAEVAAFLRRKT